MATMTTAEKAIWIFIICVLRIQPFPGKCLRINGRKLKIYIFFPFPRSMSVKSRLFLSWTFYGCDLGIPEESLRIGVESSWRCACTYLQVRIQLQWGGNLRLIFLMIVATVNSQQIKSEINLFEKTTQYYVFWAAMD